jgi:putative (di)nucleoside polyphosphate hydrolase
VKTTSHGVLILSPAGELLLCHSTGNRHWDVPKGAAAEDESGAEAAVRETHEECGLRIEPEQLLDLGRFVYRPDKDLALHAVLVERFDTRRCVCTSLFRDRDGLLRPEMDAFQWTAFVDVPRRCAKRMAKVLTSTLSLPDVMDRVAARGAFAVSLSDLVTTAPAAS